MSPRRNVRNEDAPRSETRAQEHRTRLTADKAKKSNAESGPQNGAKHKRKVEDIRERIDFLDFGYDEDFKTPEERLMKFRADVQMSQVHQKRYKIRAKRYAAKGAELLFEGRAIFAQLMVEVAESRQKGGQGAAAAANAGLP